MWQGHSKTATPGILQQPHPSSGTPPSASSHTPGPIPLPGAGGQDRNTHTESHSDDGRSLLLQYVLASHPGLINLDLLLMNLKTVLGWIRCHSG